MLTINNIKKSGHFDVIGPSGYVGSGRARESLAYPTMVTLTFNREVIERLSIGLAIRVPADWTSEITYDA